MGKTSIPNTLVGKLKEKSLERPWIRTCDSLDRNFELTVGLKVGGSYLPGGTNSSLQINMLWPTTALAVCGNTSVSQGSILVQG